MKGAILIVIYLTAAGNPFGKVSLGPMSMEHCLEYASKMAAKDKPDANGMARAYGCIREVTK